MLDNAHLEIRVMSGLHQGAAVPLCGNSIVIGSDQSCDIVLLDDSVLEEHLTIVYDGDAGWRCEFVNGAIVLGSEGERLVAPVPVDAGLRLWLGAVWLGFYPIGAPWDSLSPSIAPPLRFHQTGSTGSAGEPKRTFYFNGFSDWHGFAAGAFLSCVALVGALNLLVRSDEGGGADTVPAATPLANTSAIAQSDPATLHSPSPSFLQSEANKILRDRQLADLVRVQFLERHLIIEGELNEQEVKRLESALQAIDRVFGDEIRVTGRVTPLSASVPFKIIQIVMGADSYLVLEGGERLYVGETHAAYKLLAIRPGRLVFSGRRRVEVPW